MLSLSRIEARLMTLGLSPLLNKLRNDGITSDAELPFATVKTAKMVQRLLYQWMTFYPQIKKRVTLSLSPTLPILTIKLNTVPETRGRRRN